MKRFTLGFTMTIALACSSPTNREDAFAWSLPIESWPGGLLSVSGTSSDDVWIVGASTGGAPTILRWRGERWEIVEAPTRDTLWWVHALDEQTVFVGGERSHVSRWRDGRFESMDPPGGPEETVFGVWARAADDLYAVGGTAGRRGFVWHWDGVSWNELALPGDANEGAIFKVWGNADQVFAVGAAGRAFVRRREGSFERFDTGGTETLLTVAGNASTGEVIAVGGGSSAVVVDLEPQVVREELGVPFLQGVAFAPNGDVWASGGRGTLLRRREGRWEEIDPGFSVPGQSLHAVWIDPDGGVWAVGGDVISSPLRAGVLLHGARTSAPIALDPPPPSRPSLCGSDPRRCDELGARLDAQLLRARFDFRDRPELPLDPVPVDPDDPDDPEPDPFPAPIGTDADGDMSLDVGTGRETFVELRQGDPLRWEAGVQGGHHVWVSARLDGPSLDAWSEDERREVSTRFELTRRDGTPLGELTRLGGYRSVDGAWELVGNFSVLPTGIRPSRLDDEPLLLVVRVELPDRVLERRVWVRSECCD